MATIRKAASDGGNLGELLFGAYRRRVLALLLMHPEQSFHVREIARITGKPAGTLHRELNALAEAGLLTRSPFGNQVHYRANPACAIYDELRGILRKTVGIADVLREALDPVATQVVLAYVYGSVARGEERAGSDVDVMIIGQLKFADAVKALAPAEAELRREVNPHVYSPREFRRKLADRDPFLSRVAEGPKIYLKGTGDDLGKLVTHRATSSA